MRNYREIYHETQAENGLEAKVKFPN